MRFIFRYRLPPPTSLDAYFHAMPLICRLSFDATFRGLARHGLESGGYDIADCCCYYAHFILMPLTPQAAIYADTKVAKCFFRLLRVDSVLIAGFRIERWTMRCRYFRRRRAVAFSPD